MVVAVVVVALVAYAGSVWATIDTFAFTPTDSASGGTTYLLLGSDSREFVSSEADQKRYGGSDRTPGQRADVLIAIRIDDDGRARLLSIGRDLLVSAGGGGLTRISETYSAGPQAVAAALCDSLGLGVDHAIVLELDGLRRVVDAVGGLDLVLDTPVRDESSGLALGRGPVHLDGDAAIAFVGSRRLEHQRPDGSWTTEEADSADRPGRALQVLRLLGDDLDVSVWSPWRSHRVVWALARSVRTDDGMGVSDLDDLRTATSELGSVTPIRLPVDTTGGAVPVDRLEAGAGERLAEFEGGEPGGSCGSPTLTQARR